MICILNYFQFLYLNLLFVKLFFSLSIISIFGVLCLCVSIFLLLTFSALSFTASFVPYQASFAKYDIFISRNNLIICAVDSAAHCYDGHAKIIVS